MRPSAAWPLPLPVLALAFLLLLLPISHAGLKWPVFHAQAPTVGAPIAGPTTVYVLTSDGILNALDYVTGGQSFPYSLGGAVSIPPVRDEQALYAATDDGQLQALSLSNAKRLWRYPAIAANRSNVKLQGLAAAGGLVYMATAKELIALNASTGAVRWMRPLANGGGPAGADALRVYVADGPNLTAFSREGVPLWSLATGPLFSTRPVPDAAHNRVYVSTTNGQVLAIDAATGSGAWAYPLNGWAMGSPAVSGALVLFGGNDGRVRALDANSGQLRWATDVGGAVWGSLAIASNGNGSIAIVGTRGSAVAALDVSTGALLWSYPTSDWTGSPAIGSDGRTAIAGSRDGSVWALTLSPMCTVDSPATGTLVGAQMPLRARAWAWNGVRRVRISVGPLNLPALNLDASGPFNLTVDLGGVSEGELPISCLAEDASGLAETDAGLTKAIAVESHAAPRENMTLTVQSPVSPGSSFKLWLRDSQGQDLSGAQVAYGTTNQTADSPATLIAPLGEGDYPVVASRQGFEPATATLSVQGSTLPLLLALGVAIVVVLALFYFFFMRKKKVAEPSDYSKLQ